MAENGEDACDHKTLGKPPKGMRITGCPSCGQLFWGENGRWTRARGRVEGPVNDESVFNAVLKNVLGHRPNLGHGGKS